jgi:tRNA pseudouridine55 synthase
MDGFLNLNKPLGFTSHDCVAKVRRYLNTKKVGHAGTLDPAATGVLPIAVGRATRLLQYLPEGKAYDATVRFGITTDSDDLEGTVLTESAEPELTQEQVLQALAPFRGRIQQVPPSYSAIQVDGKRLYALARSGQMVTAPTREVEIHRIEVLAWRGGDFPEVDLAIHCGAGTYIRSIARDLGNAVGTGATLAGLKRTISSGFEIAQSLNFEMIEAHLANQTLQLAPPIDVLQHLEKISLTEDWDRRWCCGQKIVVDDLELGISDPAIANTIAYRVHNTDGDFLGISKIEPVESEGESQEESQQQFQWRLLPQMVYSPA